MDDITARNRTGPGFIWFVISILLLSSGCSESQDEGISKGLSNQVIVDANRHAIVQSLADTGLRVEKGDQIEIIATGTWAISPSDSQTDANGIPGRSAAGLPLGSLVGQISEIPKRVGEPGASFFFIGTNYTAISRSSGKLFLGFNDTDSGNNLGAVTVTIRIIP